MCKQLRLDNQICFPLYAASRKIIKAYRPYLSELNLTYPQYLVMLVLWEHQEMNVKELGEKLYLDSGTLTPLLKRLEKSEYVIRKRSEKDERVLKVWLTLKGEKLKEEAKKIPQELSSKFSKSGVEYELLKQELQKIIEN